MNESDETLPDDRTWPVRRADRAECTSRDTHGFPLGWWARPGWATASQLPYLHKRKRDARLLWPPDMSGAKSGDVVLMCGNLWLKLSVDGGKTFTDLDFTKVFSKAPAGLWGLERGPGGHYVPEIDCFVLYVQSAFGAAPTAIRVWSRSRSPRLQIFKNTKDSRRPGPDSGISRLTRSESTHGSISPTSPMARVTCTSTPIRSLRPLRPLRIRPKRTLRRQAVLGNAAVGHEGSAIFR